MSDTQHTCGNCRYFRRAEVGRALGHCHESPPSVVALVKTTPDGQVFTTADTFWPMMPDSEWCGAWIAKAAFDARAIDLKSLNTEAIEGTA